MLVGIDLGTTNSLVGVWHEGRSQLIPNALGHLLTPSAVALDEAGHTLVGLAARERAVAAPDSAQLGFKRWMGTDRSLPLGNRTLRAEELSAMVLQSLKADAESFLGQPVHEAVITVPAYFNEAQRRATRQAGELAGLKVERLLNEPTAAGLAYGLQERPDHSAFLVFDLGGGTFDVSVLEYFEGVVEVRASAGDTRLGGEDFSLVLARLFAEKALPAGEREAWLGGRQWLHMVEQGKRQLGEADSAKLRMVWQGRELSQDLERASYERACAELLQRLRRPIERALGDAQIDPAGLAEVVLVGGASRMPMVRQLVTRLFQRLPLRTIDPDQAIGQGAAVLAGLKSRDIALQEVVLTDVMPYSLGVVATESIQGRVINDRFSPIIERNTPVPVSREECYFTVRDNQTQVLIDVRQGESPVGSENLQLGTVEIEVPAAPAGQVRVDVRFSYDVNGLLDVDVRESQTGKLRNALIRTAQHEMSEDAVQAALAGLRELKRHPREEQENRYLIERARRLFEDRLGEDRRWVQTCLSAFELVLDSQDARVIRQARQTLREQLDHLDPGFRF